MSMGHCAVTKMPAMQRTESAPFCLAEQQEGTPTASFNDDAVQMVHIPILIKCKPHPQT